jgi:glucose-6-phosphate 1-epimerase
MTSTQTVADLNESFGLPGVLVFEQHGELVRAVVTTPAATATVYLQGAHLAEWQPAGEDPVLFLSAKSLYTQGKAIRGGVPVIFPWFGDRHDGQPGPAHGFARSEVWEFAFAAVVGDDIVLTLTLSPSDKSRSLGFDRFRVAYQLTIGSTLKMQLTVANEGETPFVFEEALHTYFAVADASKSSLTGLNNIEYIDKRDNGALKLQTEDPLVLTAPTDRVYFDSGEACVLHDIGGQRDITVAKTNSGSTIVWNPWVELTAKLADMEPDGWQTMFCVETGNTGPAAITLGPGEAHILQAVVSVKKTA